MSLARFAMLLALAATQPLAGQTASAPVTWAAAPAPTFRMAMPASDPAMTSLDPGMAALRPAMAPRHRGMTAAPQDETVPDRRGAMVLAGLGGAAVGMVAGGGLGLAGGTSFDGAGVGMLVGPAVTVPLAVLIANRGRGSFGLMALASAGVTAGALAAGYAADSAVPLLVGPVINVGASTTIAHATSRSRR